MVEVYDENKELMFSGGVLEAIDIMEISRTHYYDIINERTKGLKMDSPAEYFYVEGKKYSKNYEPTKRGVGYEFNFKGQLVMITAVKKTEHGWEYEFNFTHTAYARVKPKTYLSIWRMFERATVK